MMAVAVSHFNLALEPLSHSMNFRRTSKILTYEAKNVDHNLV